MSEIEIRHAHLFCGMGGGKKGFNRGRARGSAGPVITAEDEKRLETFVPRLAPIALAVHIAYWGKGWSRGKQA